MVETFGLLRTPKIYCGTGEIGRLPGLLKNRCKRALILTGSKSYAQNKAIAETISSLEKEKIVLDFERIEHEPSPEDIDRITMKYRDLDLQVVVAVGGGSVLDAGKAVSAMLPVTGPVMEYLEGVGTRLHPGIKVFFVAVPTTAGTGSECTANAVLSGSTGRVAFKRSLRHENLVPDVAIVDGLLSLSCSRSTTAASGMDALTQLIESYLSVKSGPVTDALALEGIVQIHHNLSKAWGNGENIKARSGMAYAAMLSGITLANAGLGLIHGFASSVGASFEIPHGVVCGTMMAVVNRYNIHSVLSEGDKGNLTKKYVFLGKIFSGIENRENEWYLKFVANYLDELTTRLEIPRLGNYGVTSSDLERIAAVTDHKSNPVHFKKEQLAEMMRERL
jgi:alcohol dehydrogenase class IV